MYKLIISWLDQREDFGNQLKQLAYDLESVNEKCNVGRAVGNTTIVVGGATMIAAGVATFFSGGLAAPLLTVAAGCGATGSTVTLVSKAIESWLESKSLKKAKQISEDNKKLGEKIERRIKEIAGQIRDSSGLAVADDYVVECILRAIAKKIGIPWRDIIAVAKSVLLPAICQLKEILYPGGAGQGSWFPDLETLIRDQAAGFVRQATLDVLMTAGKGAVQVSYQRKHQRKFFSVQ